VREISRRGARLTIDQVNGKKATDAARMVLALRNVLRAANWAAADLGPQVGDRAATVLREFDEAFPGVLNARDALEHFDEYAVGTGRMQGAASVSFKFRLVSEDGRPVVPVGPIRIAVDDALQVCRYLVVSLLAQVPHTRKKRRSARSNCSRKFGTAIRRGRRKRVDR
jgi:hypothetical protein